MFASPTVPVSPYTDRSHLVLVFGWDSLGVNLLTPSTRHCSKEKTRRRRRRNVDSSGEKESIEEVQVRLIRRMKSERVSSSKSDRSSLGIRLRWRQSSIGMVLVLILALQDSVRSAGHGNSGSSSTSTGCQYLNPSQLERRLRDEGDFDHRYMAADLEDAVDKFSDLADSKFIRKAEAYSCDSQCSVRTEQIRSTFAKYGQMPQPAPGPVEFAPSFADVRQVLEGHLGPMQPLAGPWSGALFPDFHPFDTSPSSSSNNPAPAPAPAVQQFPPIPMDSAFPLAPPTFGPKTTTTGGPFDYTDDSPRRVKQRRTKSPQGGFKWFAPGDLVDDSPMDDFDDSSTTPGSQRRRSSRRHPRAAPVNSTSIGQGLQIRCSKKGQEEEPGLNLLCGSCRVIRELPAEYFPRYINEISCSGQTCFDKSSQGGGRCVEQFLNFDILKNIGTSDCQKWSTYTIAVPVCCSCLMSNALAQYLSMPWLGQSLTTSGPDRPR